MTDYNALRTLLDNQLLTTANLPPHSKENTRTAIAGRTPWCRSTLLPSEPAPLAVGFNAMNQLKGLYQVDLFYPQDYGPAAASITANSVLALFPRGIAFTDGTNHIYVDMPWQQTAYTVEQVWYVIPLVIRWSSYS